MHPHHDHAHYGGALRYLLMALLIAALIVLFPITAKSHAEAVLALL